MTSVRRTAQLAQPAAQVRHSQSALPARATCDQVLRPDSDALAHLELTYLRTQIHDLAGQLVALFDPDAWRRLPGPDAVVGEQVSAADAGRADPDQHLVWVQLGQWPVLDADVLAAIEDRGSHRPADRVRHPPTPS